MEASGSISKRNKIFTNPVIVVALAVFCNLLWGSAAPSIKLGYEFFSIPTDDFFSKLVFAGIRFLTAGFLTLLAGLIINRRFPTLPKEAFGGVAVLGLVQTTIQYIFYYWGVAHLTATRSSIVNSTSTFFAIILGHLFIKGSDRMTRNKVLGCLIGFVGVIIAFNGGSLGEGFSFSGDGAITIAAFCFALASLLSKKLSAKYDGVAISGWNLAFGGSILLIIGLIGGGRLYTINTKGILILLYLCFLSAAAFTLWTLLLQSNPLGKISVYAFLNPVFGTILSVLFVDKNKDVLQINYLIALVLVCAGIILVNRNNNSNTKKAET